MKRLRLPALPLMLQVLLPLSLLLLGDAALRSWLLWQSSLQQAQARTQAGASDFAARNRARIAELASQGQLTELQALLTREAGANPALARLEWRASTGQTLQAQAGPVALQAPNWVLGGTAIEASQRQALADQDQRVGTLTLTTTLAPEINLFWPVLRQQLWLAGAMLLAALALLALSLRACLRGLVRLEQAAHRLPVQPDLRIRPAGAREIRRLTKSFNILAEALHRARDASRAQLEKTTHLANHDALTGLPNRSLLADRLRQALYRCERHQETLGLCLLDLDHFKPINDEHGNSAGDEVLVTAAQRMQAELRDTDTLARVGGDEFVLLLTSLNHAAEAQIVVERVLASLRQPIELRNGLVVHVSASAGVTTQGPAHLHQSGVTLDADPLLRQADQAMYQAKQDGRNQIRVWSKAPLPAALTEPQQPWVEQLTQAVHAGELRLHYQPKIHIRTGRLVGLEALIRWQHPTRGLLMPGEFLPQVEDSPVMVLLGQWVLAEALRQMARWQQDKTGWPVSVNVAAAQFIRPEFLDELSAALQRHPLVPSKWLTLEILETSSLDDLTLVSSKLEAVQALGVHCSLDDFGTGYSSLSYLRKLPVHEIKIDQSFVRGMLDNNGDLALVEGIITLSKVFSCKLVAEGVETPEHGVMLHRLGCSVAQGWTIAKAMPAEQVADWEKQYQPDPMWLLWTKSRWDLSHFPLMVAARDHKRWLAQVLAALDGQHEGLRADGEKNYLASRFGAWYQRLGDLHYGHLTGFHEIDLLHRRIHKLAAELIRLCQSGQAEQARPIGEELRKQSQRLIRGIDLLHQQVLSSPVSMDTNF